MTSGTKRAFQRLASLLHEAAQNDDVNVLEFDATLEQGLDDVTLDADLARNYAPNGERTATVIVKWYDPANHKTRGSG